MHALVLLVWLLSATVSRLIVSSSFWFKWDCIVYFCTLTRDIWLPLGWRCHEHDSFHSSNCKYHPLPFISANNVFRSCQVSMRKFSWNSQLTLNSSLKARMKLGKLTLKKPSSPSTLTCKTSCLEQFTHSPTLCTKQRVKSWRKRVANSALLTLTLKFSNSQQLLAPTICRSRMLLQIWSPTHLTWCSNWEICTIQATRFSPMECSKKLTTKYSNQLLSGRCTKTMLSHISGTIKTLA